MSESAEITSLLFKYLCNDLSVTERTILESWIGESETNRRFFDEVTAPGYVFAEAMVREQDDKEIDIDASWERLVAKGLPTIRVIERSRVKRLRTTTYIVAATVTLLVVAGAYWLLRLRPAQKDMTESVTTKKSDQDIAPVTNTAVLTLADGINISLDSGKRGALAIQGNTNVVKNDSGQIVYTQADNAHGELLYNTITVPKGADMVLLTLADGTKVWLNAASSMRYPVAFSGAERKVEITGEAYFEVTPNKAMPFHVSRGNVDVEVLGTHFNVNGYGDEQAIKVTLLEGSVRVLQTDTKQSQLVKPGQQAVVLSDGKITVKTIDPEAVIAWTNGIFSIDNDDIKAVMRKIARWYDVEIHYLGEVPKGVFMGQISRYLNASQVFRTLEFSSDATFRIEGRKIYVEKK
jgi:transmembrane sensor